MGAMGALPVFPLKKVIANPLRKELQGVTHRGYCSVFWVARASFIRGILQWNLSSIENDTGFDNLSMVHRFVRIFGGWGITLVLSGLLSAAIAAWGVYSPNKQYSDAAVYTAAVGHVSSSYSMAPLTVKWEMVTPAQGHISHKRAPLHEFTVGGSLAPLRIAFAYLRMSCSGHLQSLFLLAQECAVGICMSLSKTLQRLPSATQLMVLCTSAGLHCY